MTFWAACYTDVGAERKARDGIQSLDRGTFIPTFVRMWAMLTDIARQKEHGGRKYTPDQWKCLFMHACGREMQFVPSLDGTSFMPLGYRSSELSKQEMSDLIECMLAWGAENGVVFHDQPPAIPEDVLMAG